MPSDAKILREQGRAALREFYRRRNNARRGVTDSPPPTECIDCGVPISQSAHGRRLRCPACILTHRRALDLDRWHQRGGQPSHAVLRCVRCGVEMDGGRWNQRKFCPSCRTLRDRELSRIGASCLVRYSDCEVCGAVVAGNRSRRVCSARCMYYLCYQRLKSDPDAYGRYLDYMREYYRTNRKTASRYWRIADTPAGQELAEAYFELRMEIRPRAKWKDRYREYRAAKRQPSEYQGDPEHTVGAGAKAP